MGDGVKEGYLEIRKGGERKKEKDIDLINNDEP